MAKGWPVKTCATFQQHAKEKINKSVEKRAVKNKIGHKQLDSDRAVLLQMLRHEKAFLKR